MRSRLEEVESPGVVTGVETGLVREEREFRAGPRFFPKMARRTVASFIGIMQDKGRFGRSWDGSTWCRLIGGVLGGLQEMPGGGGPCEKESLTHMELQTLLEDKAFAPCVQPTPHPPHQVGHPPAGQTACRPPSVRMALALEGSH